MGRDAALAGAQRLFDAFAASGVIVAGFCGGLDPALAAGDLVVPSEVVESVDGIAVAPTHGTPGVRLVTTAEPAATPEDKRRLAERFEAQAVDMESFAVGVECERRRISWRCVRAVSDTADQSLDPALAALVDDAGRTRYGAAAAHALAGPWRIGAMVRVGIAGSRASKALSLEIERLVSEAV